MSKKDTSSQDGTTVTRQRFKVAYSINNWQPVECTHISDQPFFYMDESHEIDEAILSEEFFDEDINNVKEQIRALEIEYSHKEFKSRDDLKSQRLKEFNLDIDYITQDYIDEKSDEDALLQVISKTMYGQALLDYAQKGSLELNLSKNIAQSYLDVAASKIFINKNLDFNEQIILAITELRRHWQQGQGANLNPLKLSPDCAILINRAQKADLALATIRLAWELKLQNYNDLWERIKISSVSDLAHAFECESKNDFRSLNNGKASSAVFETWFLSERCDHEDKILVQNMLSDQKAYKFDMKSENESYITSIITAIGAQPVGKNYLNQYAHYIVHDGLFTEVRDRSTANFLWFIKFEHRFEEAECELQSSGAIKIDDADQHHENQKSEDAFNANANKNGHNVVLLRQFQPKHKSTAGQNSDHQGDYL